MGIQGLGTVSRWCRWILFGIAILSAAALAAIWLWPELPLVLQVVYSLVVGSVLLLIGLVWVMIRARGPVRLAFLAVSMAAVAVGVWGLDGSLRPTGSDTPEETVPAIDFSSWNCNRESCAVPTMNPGIIIGNGAPSGWSQLIFKIKPRYRPEAGSVLPGALVEVTNRFFLAMAARVEQQPRNAGARFVLQSVGGGVGAECKDGDRLTSTREKILPPELSGFLFRPALSAIENDVSSSAVIARTPNMWIVDTPVRSAHQGDGYLITRRYALWADPRTGRVTTLYWDIPRGKQAHQPDAEKAYQLPIGLVEELPLVINKGRSGFDALFALSRRPTAPEFALAVPWRAELNESALQEHAVRLLEEELARRFTGAGPREGHPQ